MLNNYMGKPLEKIESPSPPTEFLCVALAVLELAL